MKILKRSRRIATIAILSIFISNMAGILPNIELMAPIGPSNLILSGITTNSIDLNWDDNSPDELGFNIERATSFFGPYGPVTSTIGDVTAYSDGGLNDGTTYYYRISSYDGSGSSGYEYANATTLLAPPDAPDNLILSGETTSSIDLSWSDNSDSESGFLIERRTAVSSFTQVGTTGLDENTYTDNGLVEDTEYFYQVRATNSAGESGYTSAASTSTLLSLPNAPSGLTLSGETATTIDLNWVDNSDNESGFFIERRTSVTSFTQVATPNAEITSYTDTGLEEDTRYFYRVRATNSTGESNYTNAVSTYTLLLPSLAPTDLALSGETTSSIELTWSDNSDNESGFLIERRTSITTFSDAGSTAADENTFSDTGLEDNTGYYYRVRATNATGESGYSNIASTFTLLSPPDAPSGLTLSGETTSSIILTWIDNSDSESGFLIERRTAITSYGPVGSTAADAVTFTDNGLENNTEYFYRVRATNTAGESGYSNEASSSTLLSAPDAPDLLALSNVTVNSIDLEWSDNSDNETGFLIERRTAITLFAQEAITGMDVTSFSDAGLEDNTQYYYRVRATNGSGESGYSNVASETTLLDVPESPSGLSGVATSVCTVELTWTDNSISESGFEIERSQFPTSGFTQVQLVGANVVSYTDIGTENLNDYYYRIRALNAAGNSDFSAVSAVPVNIVLSGGVIGSDQSVCPGGDPDALINLVTPSGGSGNWMYQWQISTTPGLFTDIPSAINQAYNPPPGLPETSQYQRIATTECGVATSNVSTITIEDLESPQFVVCPNDTLIEIDRGIMSTVVLTQNPVVSDNCGIMSQTWSMTGATMASSPGVGINFIGSRSFNLGVTNVVYQVQDMSGNTEQCRFDVVVGLKNPEIVDVTIQNIPMNIDDVVTATITVGNDGGIPFSLLSGTVGGYTLADFQRYNATTYLANFTVFEGGNSFQANEQIPVNSMIITDGSAQSLPYNLPIVQDNDLLDAVLPVIVSMTADPGTFAIGDIVVITIRSDGLGYNIHPNSNINGIDLSTNPANVNFSEIGSGYYSLTYMVQEGDNDVAAGEFAVSVTLIEPSENVSLPGVDVVNSQVVIIDAHPPVITRMELPSVEVGVGGTVQVTITADGEGYLAGPGTIINGIPLSSPRVTFAELSGGLYELIYTVDINDAAVAPGSLQMSLVMIEPSGNASIPYSIFEQNSLEIYTELPTAILAPPPEICEDDDALLTVFLSGGKSPWSIDIDDGSSVVTYDGIDVDQYQIVMNLSQTTTYKIISVRDVNGTLNSDSDDGETIQVNPKTEVNIINLASGYNVEADPVKLEADVPGGTFSGPGVLVSTGYFDPGIADTINSPHIIYYTYENANGCISVDSAQVFVLGANGAIYIPSNIVCHDTEPFLVSASNIAGVNGEFTLFDENEENATGLTDNGDNTATVDPALLLGGNYSIEYHYKDQVDLYLMSSFLMEIVEEPVITSLDQTTFCQNDNPVALNSNEPAAVFSGSGVIGNLTDGFLFDPGQANLGSNTITCTVATENGCSNSVQTDVEVRYTPEVMFSVSEGCLALEGGAISFNNMTSNKSEVGTWSWNFGDPASGEDNQSSLIDPTHFYLQPGTRVISLTATTLEGCVATHELDTIFGQQPVADFIWVTDCYTDGSSVEFLNRSENGSVSPEALIWTFKESNGSVLGQEITNSMTETVSYAFGAADNYIVDLIVKNEGSCADTISKEIVLRPTIQLNDDEYYESFDNSEGMWTIMSEDQRESWVWDEPDFSGFYPVTGDRGWFTKLPDNIIDYNETSWLQSPCFDFSGLDRPLIKMDIMRSFMPVSDGAVLQYRDAIEEGWKTIGENASGIGWYNASNITKKPGGSSEGWGLNVFNPDTKWLTTAHDLDQVGGKPNVSFRIAIASGGIQGIGNQGFAFDNVIISKRTRRSVVEYFTNSGDSNSGLVDIFVDSLSKANYADAIDLQYHMDYPGIDLMNENNPLPASVRAFNYGVREVPFAILDGGESDHLRYGFVDADEDLSKDLRMQILEFPSFDIDLSVEWLESGLEATTTVTCLVDEYPENINLYLVVFESSVTAYSGANGDNEFRNVVLKMLPSPRGVPLGNNWYKGMSDIRTNTWTYESYVENIEELAVVAFIQKRTAGIGSILQANVNYADKTVPTAVLPSDLESMQIYPNPAKSSFYINFGNPSEVDGTIELMDMSGRVVMSEHVPAGYQIYQVQVDHLKRGIYIIQWFESGLLKGMNKVVKTE